MNHLDPLASAEQAIRSGDIEQACRILQANLGDKRLFADIRLTLAELYLRQKKLSPAQTLLREVIAQFPKNVRALALLACAYRSMGALSEAARYLGLARQIKSTSQNDLKFISTEFIALGAYADAVRTIKKIEPMDAQCFYHLGLAHFKMGQIGKALPIYRKLFSSIPDNPTIARELSLVAAAFREYDTAIEAYGRYMQLIQPNAADYLKFSDLQLMNRDVSASEEHLAKAVSMGESSANSRLLQARLSRLKGDYSRSLSEAREVINRLPESGTAWQIISELIEPSKVDINLVNQLKTAISTSAMSDQDRELAHFALAELYIKQKKYPAAYEQMHSANQTKAGSLHKQGLRYDRKATEILFDAMIQSFSERNSIRTSKGPHRPVFVIGMPRSGTTVVNRILEASGQLQCVGESEAVPYIYSQLQLRYGGGTKTFAKKLTEDDWGKLATDYLQRVKSAHQEIVDKMPSNFLYVGIILSMFPHARIIQLRRNPFDVCMSIYAKAFPDGHSYACDVNDLAHFYFQANALMDHWSHTYPTQIFDLDFNRFLEKPQACAEQLFSFLECNWDKAYLDPPQKASQAFTFSELQVRKPISKSEAGKWQPFAEIASNLIRAISSESPESTDND